MKHILNRTWLNSRPLFWAVACSFHCVPDLCRHIPYVRTHQVRCRKKSKIRGTHVYTLVLNLCVYSYGSENKTYNT